jgi:glycosyltransferase involved in cell wall biosynthesis
MGREGPEKIKVCIVTPDIIGPIKNGGIGTACYWLAKFLARESYHVTVLFTGAIEIGSFRKHRRFYQELGVRFVELDPSDRHQWPVYGGEWFLKRSRRVRDYLDAEHFDIVQFQDWHANGFMAIQAKKTGLGFPDTELMVVMHATSAWRREGNRQWPQQPVSDAVLDFCERYCCENADVLVSPSRYMFQWAESRGWTLPDLRRVVPYLVGSAEISGVREAVVDEDHLAFFGRLESRKGLELFCKAIDLMRADRRLRSRLPQKISFIGKDGSVDGYASGLSCAKDYAAKWEKAGIKSEFFTEYYSFQALDYLKRTGAVAVIPSLVDNYPYTVIECLALKIPFMASSQGGIPEMVSGGAIFHCDPRVLAETLADRGKRVTQIHSLYSADVAREGWLSLLNECRLPHPGKSRRIGHSTGREVSVCVAYYNLGKYLPELLRSLAESDYENFQVIAINDGSTKEFDNEVFERQKKVYQARGWEFYEKPNEGSSAARNFAATMASGDYLIFMDADNIATPTMISDFSRAMECSGADCLTTHFPAFSEEETPVNDDFKPLYSYWPVGSCISAGLAVNVFGDANLCVKQEVFHALGGFSGEIGGAYEDWKFLAHLCLAGYKLDVIPEHLFYYRHRQYSKSRTANPYLSHLEVSRAYLTNCDSHTRDILVNLTIPLFHGNVRHGLDNLSHRALDRVLEKIHRHPRLEKLLTRVFHVFTRMSGLGSSRG